MNWWESHPPTSMTTQRFVAPSRITGHQYSFASRRAGSGIGLTSDDLEEFVSSDPDDGETVPLGQALSELGLDAEFDSVEIVRDVRERGSE